MSGTTDPNATSATMTDAPPPRPRRTLVETPADATPQQAQAVAEANLAAADTSILTELDRTALETQIAIARRAAEEQAQEALAAMAAERMAEQQAIADEHQKALDEYNARQQAIREATMESPAETPEGMVRVTIVSNVSVLRDDGTMTTYTAIGSNTGIPGVWDMPKEDADHWYVQQHTDKPPPPPPPQPGTAASVSIAMRVQAARAQAEYLLEQQQYAQQEAQRQERVAAVQAAMGDAFVQSAPPEPPTPPPPAPTAGPTGDPPPTPVQG